jgi:hypothetical protein
VVEVVVALEPVEQQIVASVLEDELTTLAAEVGEHLRCGPVEPHDLADARWKIERMGTCMEMLAKLGRLPREHVRPAGEVAAVAA